MIVTELKAKEASFERRAAWKEESSTSLETEREGDNASPGKWHDSEMSHKSLTEPLPWNDKRRWGMINFEGPLEDPPTTETEPTISENMLSDMAAVAADKQHIEEEDTIMQWLNSSALPSRTVFSISSGTVYLTI